MNAKVWIVALGLALGAGVAIPSYVQADGGCGQKQGACGDKKDGECKDKAVAQDQKKTDGQAQEKKDEQKPADKPQG